MPFSQEITTWYNLNKRDLPWRTTKNPYYIWLSEVILQQTRVDQGLSYYEKFIFHFPDIQSLALSSEENVLKLWQGLGYYSRARNLHHAAKEIVEKYNGKFPSDYKEIIALKGIGKYTAAAISSICFNLPHAVIDGNVYRVLSRIYGIDTPIDSTAGKNTFEKLANELLDRKNAGTYNQALMEFGALHCKPRNPDCNSCIFMSHCYAFLKNEVQRFPVKAKKIKQRTRHFNYLVIRSKGFILLNKRTADDIWKNLYDFPLIENEKKISKKDIVDSDHWKNIFDSTDVVIQKVSEAAPHILSHQKILATFWEIHSNEFKHTENENYTAVRENELFNYPVPKLIENYISQ